LISEVLRARPRISANEFGRFGREEKGIDGGGLFKEFLTK